MTGGLTLGGPDRAVFLDELVNKLMDIILHVGAHRTATTSFQHYLRAHSRAILDSGTGFWGPWRTRKGLFSGLFRGPGDAMRHVSPDRVKGRIALQLAKSRDSGLDRLVITDENMIGTSRHCLKSTRLFPAAGDRMARYNAAFDGRITRILLTVRSPEMWWSSAAAYAINRGHPVPSQFNLDKIAQSTRSWRDVIIDMACAMPEARIKVTTFEETAGRPDLLLAHATGVAAPKDAETRWMNRAPDVPALRRLLAARGESPDLLPDVTGRWQPFSETRAAEMRETYADDLFWLAAGADGLATLTEQSFRKRAGTSQPAGDMKKGHDHDSRQRTVAQPS